MLASNNMSSNINTDEDKDADTRPTRPEEVVRNGVRCDLCEFWHHSKCVTMLGNTYNFLGQTIDPRQCGMLQWLFPGCQRGASKVMLLLQNIITTQSKHEDKLKNMKEDITDLYKEFDKCNKAITSTNTSNDFSNFQNCWLGPSFLLIYVSCIFSSCLNFEGSLF